MKRHPRDIATATARTEINLKLDRAEWNNYEDILNTIVDLKRELLNGTLRINTPTIATGLTWQVRTIILIAVAEYSLTDHELYQILTNYELQCTKYILRYERHGDFDKEAGLAYE